MFLIVHHKPVQPHNNFSKKPKTTRTPMRGSALQSAAGNADNANTSKTGISDQLSCDKSKGYEPSVFVLCSSHLCAIPRDAPYLAMQV